MPKGSMEPEFIQIRIVGDDQPGAKRTVLVNAREKKEGIGRPLLVQPGRLRVSVTGFVPKEVRVRGGETDFGNPKLVDFLPSDALSSGR